MNSIRIPLLTDVGQFALSNRQFFLPTDLRQQANIVNFKPAGTDMTGLIHPPGFREQVPNPALTYTPPESANFVGNTQKTQYDTTDVLFTADNRARHEYWNDVISEPDPLLFSVDRGEYPVSDPGFDLGMMNKGGYATLFSAGRKQNW